jgi:integrase
MASMFRLKRKRADGTVYTAKTWYGKWVDADGVEHRKKLSPDKAISKTMLGEITGKVLLQRAGIATDAQVESTGPIDGFIKAFEKHYDATDCNRRHVQQVMKQVRDVATGCGFTKLDEISRDDVESYLAFLTKSGKSAKTRNHYLSAFRTFVNWCIDKGVIQADPLRKIKTLNVEKDRRRVRRALTLDEATRLVDAARRRPVERAKYFTHHEGLKLADEDRERFGRKHALMWKMMMMTGLRRGELRGLQWADVDLDGGWLTVRASVAKNGGERHVPLAGGLIDDLRAWESTEKPKTRQAAVVDVPANLVRILKADLKYAGIEYAGDDGRTVDCHALRHTARTWMELAGMRERAINLVMGHKTSRMGDVYTDKKLINVSEAAAVMPELPAVIGAQIGIQIATAEVA